MRLLVLGPAGQLGGDIMDEAAARGIEALPAGRDAVDVEDTDALRRLLGETAFDVAVNCTSYHRTDEVEDHPARAIAVNATAPQAMAEACAAKGARLVHISTDYVFGGHAAAAPLTEEARPAPVNLYGLSKLYGESLAGLAAADAVIFRVASLFGVRGASGKGGNFVETMLRVGREKGALRVVDDQVMTPTATADIAAALLDFLAADGPAGLYHCVNRGPVSWCGFAREIVARAGVDAEVAAITSAEFPTRARRPGYSALDPAKLEAVIGRGMAPWQDALERYLAAKGHAR